MSNISTVIDTLRTFVPTTVGTTRAKYELDNPYILEENIDNKLNLGWAVRANFATNTNRYTSHHTEERSFTIILTRRVSALKVRKDSITTDVKQLLEDALLLKLELQKSSQLGIPNAIMRSAWSDDTGINSLIKDNNAIFIFTEINFLIEIKEDLTC